VKTLHYSDGQGKKTLQADIVLMAAGRKASLNGIDAAKIGLALDQKGNIVVDETLKTNLENVFAAGDVVGGWQLAHSAYAEAETAVENMLGVNQKAQLDIMPRCVYTLPPYAAVGLNKQQAEKKGIQYTEGKFAFAANGMALAEGAGVGTARVLADKQTGKIIGAQIVGIGATEMIATAVAAIHAGITVKQYARTITAHPSLSEIFHEAVLDNEGISLHTPVRTKIN
jgi:dihydrolipoamide dehydrogenase